MGLSALDLITVIAESILLPDVAGVPAPEVPALARLFFIPLQDVVYG